MADEAYEVALRRALVELAEVDRQAEEIERRRATLRQSVAVLQTLAGCQPDQEQSVTGSILTILKASAGPLPTAGIVQRLISMGHTPQPTSVATLLSRLAQQGKIMKADDGYAYSTIDLENPKTLADAVLEALKAIPGFEQSLTAAEVQQYLEKFQLRANLGKIETTLAHLAKGPNRFIDERVGNGVLVYYWRGPERNRQEQTLARDRLKGMDKKNLG